MIKYGFLTRLRFYKLEIRYNDMKGGEKNTWLGFSR
jgi:hypothetical protein